MQCKIYIVYQKNNDIEKRKFAVQILYTCPAAALNAIYSSRYLFIVRDQGHNRGGRDGQGGSEMLSKVYRDTFSETISIHSKFIFSYAVLGLKQSIVRYLCIMVLYYHSWFSNYGHHSTYHVGFYRFTAVKKNICRDKYFRRCPSLDLLILTIK